METVEPGALIWSMAIHHLWEATVFAGLVAVLLLAWRRAPARVRHAFLLLASLKFLVPSFLVGALAVRLEVAGWLVRGFHRVLPEPLSAWLPAAAGGPESLGPVPPGAWLLALGGLWALGLAVCLLRWRDRHRELASLVGASRPVEEGISARLEALHRRLELRRRVRAVTSEAIQEPAVWGALRPVLLLPEGVARHLSDDELDAVLLHELLHVRRRDNLVAAGVHALGCLFWFHPLIWWLERRILTEREQVVDEEVVALGSGSKVYARGLLKVVRFGLGLQPAGVSSAGVGGLAERIERILSPAAPRGPGLVQRALSLVGVAVLVFFSLLPLPRSVCPTLLAEQDPARFVHVVPEASSPSSTASTMRTSPKPDCTG